MNINLIRSVIKTNEYQRQSVRKVLEQSPDFRKVPFIVKEAFYKRYDDLINKTTNLLNNLEELDSEEYDTWVKTIRDFDNFTYDIFVKTYKVKLGDVL